MGIHSQLSTYEGICTLEIRNRIKELRSVKASELLPHPKNWRMHSNLQRDAVKGMLEDVGFAGAELAIELEDGSLQLIDGHLRAEIAGDEEVPVLVLDLTAEEAEKVLVTFDPLGSMASSDPELLEQLVSGMVIGSLAVQDLISDLLPEDASANLKVSDDDGALIHNQAVQLKPKREFIVVMCDSEGDREYLDDLLTLAKVRRGGYKKGSPFDAVSKERVVTTSRLREAINASCSTE